MNSNDVTHDNRAPNVAGTVEQEHLVKLKTQTILDGCGRGGKAKMVGVQWRLYAAC